MTLQFIGGFILGCFFATGAIFLFCAFAYDPYGYPQREALDEPKLSRRLSSINAESQSQYENAANGEG